MEFAAILMVVVGKDFIPMKVLAEGKVLLVGVVSHTKSPSEYTTFIAEMVKNVKMAVVNL